MDWSPMVCTEAGVDTWGPYLVPISSPGAEPYGFRHNREQEAGSLA